MALKDLASEVGGLRSLPALASALAWLGSGGGILMSPIAEPVGTHSTVIVVSLIIGLGLLDLDLRTAMMWIGHGLFIGLIGLDGISAPFYVSRWFDRRRG